MDNGLRNEPARQRHRQRKKEICGCTSLPASIVASETSKMYLARAELSETNHFGWSVCGKCGHDPEFERRMQTKEKPDLPERDDNASTYVLCVEESARPLPSKPPPKSRYVPPSQLPDGDFQVPYKPPTRHDRESDVSEKATQTSIRGIVQTSDEKDKKKKLISEFFFTPLRARSRSRSPSTGKSKQKLLGQLTDEPRVYLDRESKSKINKKGEQDKEGSDKKNADKKKNKSKKNLDDKKDEVIQTIEEYEKEVRKDIEGRKKVIIKGINDNENIEAARRAVSETEESKKNLLGSGKVRLKKLPLRAGNDSSKSISAKTDSGTEDQSSKSSIVYHLQPVRPKHSSSEHLLDTPSGANRYLYLPQKRR